MKREVRSAIKFRGKKVSRAQSQQKKVAPRLYARGVFTGFRRSKAWQYNHTALIKIEGVNDRKSVDYYLGKRCVYIYKTRTKLQDSKFRTIWGRITRPHGGTGAVRAKFLKNLPPTAMGKRIRVMLYPSNV